MVIITVVVILLYRLQDSRLGRAWVALREDELAAASMGINTITTKLLAFSIGASTAGLAGVFYAAKLSTVTPDQFGFSVSFTALAMVVLGGMGNIWGVAAGAFIIYELQSQGLQQLGNFVQGLNVQAFTLGTGDDRHRVDQLHQLPVPAVRPGARRDDAVQTRGPVPEPAQATRAPRDAGRGRADGRRPDGPDRA